MCSSDLSTLSVMLIIVSPTLAFLYLGLNVIMFKVIVLQLVAVVAIATLVMFLSHCIKFGIIDLVILTMRYSKIY